MGRNSIKIVCEFSEWETKFHLFVYPFNGQLVEWQNDPNYQFSSLSTFIWQMMCFHAIHWIEFIEIHIQCVCARKLHAILIVSPQFRYHAICIESEAAFLPQWFWFGDNLTKLLMTVSIFTAVCNVTSPPINNWPLVRHMHFHFCAMGNSSMANWLSEAECNDSFGLSFVTHCHGKWQRNIYNSEFMRIRPINGKDAI